MTGIGAPVAVGCFLVAGAIALVAYAALQPATDECIRTRCLDGVAQPFTQSARPAEQEQFAPAPPREPLPPISVQQPGADSGILSDPYEDRVCEVPEGFATLDPASWPSAVSAPWEQPIVTSSVLEARYTQVRGPTPHDQPDIDDQGVNQKGAWAERQFEDYMNQQGWDLVGKHFGQGGLDGVYRTQESSGKWRYVVVEVKYRGRYEPTFNPEIQTESGIRRRLSNAVIDIAIAEDMIRTGYETWRVKVLTDGSIQIKPYPSIPPRQP